MLQQIVHQLDAELERLQTLRDIVAGLHGAPLPIEVELPATDVHAGRGSSSSSVPQATPEATKGPTTPRTRLQRRPRHVGTAPAAEKPSAKPASPAAELRALQSVIPAGPVVVSAQGLARERETRAATKTAAGAQAKTPEAEAASMDALTRSLANRWRVGTDSTTHTP